MRLEAQFCGTFDLTGGYITALSGGHNDRLFVLVCLGEKDDGWIERRDACDWRILSVDRSGVREEVQVRNQKGNFTLVQPLPGGVLLATRRCEFSEDSLSSNGLVFDLEGGLLRSLLLGDGIEDLQTTSAGQIWVSYFDEGIYGNLGWKRPVGSCGLRTFDSEGNSTFEFEPVSGLDGIDDCYALNVTGDTEAWCYYYSQFPIVRIEDMHIAQYWLPGIQGASELCIWRDTVLIQGGYQSDDWKLMHLENDGLVRLERSFEFVDGTGRLLRSSSARARGDSLWFVEGQEVYRIRLRDLLSLTWQHR